MRRATTEALIAWKKTIVRRVGNGVVAAIGGLFVALGILAQRRVPGEREW